MLFGMTLRTMESLIWAQRQISARDAQSGHEDGGADAHFKAGNSKTLLRGRPTGSPEIPALLYQSLCRDSSELKSEDLRGDEGRMMGRGACSTSWAQAASAQIGGCVSAAGGCCGSAGLHRRTEAAVSGQSYTAWLPLRTFTDLYRRLGCCPIWHLLQEWEARRRSRSLCRTFAGMAMHVQLLPFCISTYIQQDYKSQSQHVIARLSRRKNVFLVQAHLREQSHIDARLSYP